MAGYLKLRKGKYSVRLPVPKHLWDLVGKREIVRATGTGDLAEAKRRRHAIIDRIHTEWEELVTDDPSSPSWLQKQALAIRKAVQLGAMTSEDASDIIGTLRDQHLKANNESPEDDFTPRPEAQLVAFSRLAFDTEYSPISSLAESYLTERGKTVTASTARYKARVLKAFQVWLVDDIDVNDVDRKLAGRYVTENLMNTGLSARTVRGYIAELSTFLTWCIDEGSYDGDDNPFTRLKKRVPESKRGSKDTQLRKMTPKELTRLFEGMPSGGKYHLREFTAIGLWSAMRLDEIASLRIEDIDLDEMVLQVTDGKTDAAVRQVPVATSIQPATQPRHLHPPS